ncbi:uncharacterized protein LOC122004415 [Zingiber officinale]|uniref:uncharacterized protein LOC122004415 n=1 Tax=Zingiber officinale TaxID=94328 RepID=UPI001C4AC2DA|nr:uncharacterized protein LOC122004415 [Zingiber officinale]
MKKLGSAKGRKVHSSLTPKGHLAALPAAVLALVATLTAEEQEVLAYLLSGGGRWWAEQRRRRAHAPELGCGCFGCYTSFWARWDASPNRHAIHIIIDAVEENLESAERDLAGRRRRQRARKGGDLAAVEGSVAGGRLGIDIGTDFHDNDKEEEEEEEEEDNEVDEKNSHESQSSVRKLMSYIGESVWGVWN